MAKEGAVNGTPLGLEFWFICWACLGITNMYYRFKFLYFRLILFSPGGEKIMLNALLCYVLVFECIPILRLVLTSLNSLNQWLRRVPTTAPLSGAKLFFSWLSSCI
jgi:hypothetical protein